MSIDDPIGAQLAEISNQLDTVVGFLAIRGLEADSNAMIIRLRELGLGTRTMSHVLGLSENAVAIRLSRLKKKAGRSSAT